MSQRAEGEPERTSGAAGWTARFGGPSPNAGLAAVAVVAIVVGGLVLSHGPQLGPNQGQGPSATIPASPRSLVPPTTGIGPAPGPGSTNRDEPIVVPPITVPTIQPATVETPGPATTFASWTRIDLPDPAPDANPGVYPSAVVAFDGGYVAAGTIAAGGCCDGGDPSRNSGVVWLSPDGRAWKVRAGLTVFEHASLDGLVSDGRRLLAYGTYAAPVQGHVGTPVPAVWVSLDGRTWRRSSDPVPSYVAVGPHGFVGAMVADASARGSLASFATSADGLTWTSVSLPYLVDDLRLLTGDPAGHLLALGSVPGNRPVDGSSTWDVVAWRSDDGLAWGAPETIFLGAVPLAAAADGQGFVVVSWIDQPDPGSGPNPSFEVWRLQPDGVELLPLWLGGEDTMDSIDALDGTIVVTGTTTVAGAGELAVWVSTDAGATWGVIPDRFLAGAVQLAAVLLSDTDGLLAVGSGGTVGPHHVPVAWLATR
jgi:hypothetical protein